MMNGYQETELGLIPIDWKIIELNDIAKCTVGIATSTTHAYCENGVLLLRNQNIKEGKIALNDVLFINPEFDELNKSKRLKENDIITVRTGYPGISAVVPKELEGAQSFTTLIIRLNEQKPLSKYLCYYINSEKGKSFFTNNQAGGGQQNVGAKTLQTMKIPIPPLPEQQKIADILSTVDAKIDLIDQQIKETQELKKGLMQRLLTKGIGHTEFKDSPLGRIPESWEVVKQSEVATFYNGRAYKRTEWEETGIPVIRLQNLTGSGKDYYYSKLKLPEHQYCYRGDLLYMWSATFGPVWWFGDKAIYHYHIWKIEHDIKRLDKNFHFYLLDSVTSRMKNESHGSTMLHVTKGGMEKLPIQLPSLIEQKKISQILISVDEKLNVLSVKKETYQDLKKGLMQQLLTGKVRVKV